MTDIEGLYNELKTTEKRLWNAPRWYVLKDIWSEYLTYLRVRVRFNDAYSDEMYKWLERKISHVYYECDKIVKINEEDV